MISMTTSVPKQKLLETLRANLAKHTEVVQEARDGYIKKAKKALEKRMEQLRKGQLVSLQFTLTPPADYSNVYKNAISMLEWNTDEIVKLEPGEFKKLVHDEWDWTTNWLRSSSGYTQKAQSWLDELQGGSLVAPEE